MSNRRFELKGRSRAEIERAAMLLLLNYRHGEVASEFLADLRATVDEVRAGKVTSRGENAIYTV